MKLKEYNIWTEGYLVTGMEGIPAKAKLWGKYKGQSFEEACNTCFTKDNNLADFFNGTNLTFFGCKIYDNEKDARKLFG